MLTRSRRILDVTVAALITAACMFLLFKMDIDIPAFVQSPAPIPVNVSVPGSPAPQVAKTPKVKKPIHAKAVAVYPDKAKKALKLSKELADNPEFAVVSSIRIPADRHSTIATTGLNLETGETATEVRREPLPWIGANHSGQLGMYVLQKSAGQVVQVEAQQSLVQLKALNIGVKAAIEQPLSGPGGTDYRVGFGGWVNW